MATITINNYIQGARLYGVIDSGGGDYTQSSTPEFLALLEEQTFNNGNFAGSILPQSSTVNSQDCYKLISVIFAPEMPVAYPAELLTVSDATTEATGTTAGLGANIYNLEKIDYSYLLDRITSQFRG